MTHSKQTILVVDNDELVLNSISARLSNSGYEVLPVVNSMQALSVFREREVDLVVADINMPGLDGIGLAEDIRKLDPVPIILITAYPGDYPACAKHLSGVELLSKPFSWEEISARIQEAIGAPAT